MEKSVPFCCIKVHMYLIIELFNIIFEEALKMNTQRNRAVCVFSSWIWWTVVMRERNGSGGPEDNKHERGGSSKICLFIFFVSLYVFINKDVPLAGAWASLLSGILHYASFWGKRDRVWEGLRTVFLHLMFFQNFECHSLGVTYSKHHQHFTSPLRPYIHFPAELLGWSTSFFYT